MKLLTPSGLILLLLCASIPFSPIQESSPPPHHLEQRIQEAVTQAITAHQTPGAVVLVSCENPQLVKPWQICSALGNRSLVPVPEPLTADTIFDLASLTKPIVTATCIGKLVEDGKLKSSDKIGDILPSFGQNGKANIAIEHLLLHTSGLVADNVLADYEGMTAEAYAKIDALKLLAPPGSKFIYSDVGYIVLGRVVEKLTGKPLDQVAREWIFEPLEMRDSGFTPPRILHPRCAPTEKIEGVYLRGIVHDPRARKLQGVSGHAGLFSTAADLQKFALMLLHQGTHQGKKILQPDTVRWLTQAHYIPGGGIRTCGWDMDTAYSTPRGDGFPSGLSYGHTGFTGTSLWMDPSSRTIVIILTNRVHPDGKGNVTSLRRSIANLVAEELRAQHISLARSPVLTGLDVLRREKFAPLQGKRVGLVTNQTGQGRDSLATIDILHQAEQVKLAALFCPEHGIRGLFDEKMEDSRDEKTGLPIYSLYGKHLQPTAEQLRGLDILVFDLQDIGCRFYTYISTLGLLLDAAAQHNIPILVLDRPNPIDGLHVEGPLLDAGAESFVGFHRIPIRHGMTVGELARLFNAERHLHARLSVIKMEGWQRSDTFDQTGLAWINPSPNMRCLQAALLYPGVGILETTNLSVGRGTDRPFEIVGAPWIDGVRWARELQLEKISGLRWMPLLFTPLSSVYAKQRCQGVSIIIEDASQVHSVRIGLALAVTLRRLYPTEWQANRLDRLLGHQETFRLLKAGRGVQELLQVGSQESAFLQFLELRKKYLLY
jgi:uncharacterized protein YbbC (DUF1343 family)/CubicO group peptidase (beta-lactamase class C family)